MLKTFFFILLKTSLCDIIIMVQATDASDYLTFTLRVLVVVEFRASRAKLCLDGLWTDERLPTLIVADLGLKICRCVYCRDDWTVLN